MTKLGYLALAVSFAAAAACSDNDPADMDTPPVATANGVFPSSGLIGRELIVEVSGNNTNWSSTSTVSFGAGVTVNSTMVASPTDLIADITIAPTATPGTTDVTVTDGSDTFTLAKAFTLSSAMALTIDGTVAQGSIGFFTIHNKDFDNPFDTTTDPIFGTYTNLALTGPSGSFFSIQSATEYTISGQVTFDTDAATGPVTLVSGPPNGTTVTSTVNDFSVATRSPMALTNGTAASYMVNNPEDSGLFQFSATNPTLLTVDVTSNAQTASPTQIILPNSGHWADVSNGTNFTANYDVIPAGESRYPVAIDVSGTTGFSVSVTPTATTMTAASDTDPGNDAKTGATAVTLPALVTNGDLSTTSDQDWFKFTVTAADAGKSVHVLTGGANAFTDTAVDIQDTTGASIANGPVDQWYHEDVVSSPLTTAQAAAGTIFVQIQPGSFFQASDHVYIAGIWLQ